MVALLESAESSTVGGSAASNERQIMRCNHTRSALALGAALLTSLGSASAQQAERHNVALLIFQGVELLDFAGPGEVFAAAGGQFNTYTVALTKDPVGSLGIVDLVPQYTIDDCPDPDLIIVPGGNVPIHNERLQAWIGEHFRSGELTMSVCNGTSLLATSGALSELEVTTHHSAFNAVVAFEPTATPLLNRRFVDNGNVLTTAGISAGIDGALHMVARLAGQERAQSIATYMEYHWRPAEIEAFHAQPALAYARQHEPILRDVDEHGLQGAVDRYKASLAQQSEIDRSVPSFHRLRTLAEQLMAKPENQAHGVRVFEFAVAAYPNSFTLRDGLSGAYELVGQVDASLEHARAAAEMAEADTRNREDVRNRILTSASERIERLESGLKAESVFVCPCPACPDVRSDEGGGCPECGMVLVRQVVSAEIPAGR